jgi:hypothetical protein
MELPPNLGQLNQFLHQEHWVLHVQGFTPSELRQLITTPEPTDGMDDLSKHVLGYMEQVQVLIPGHDSFGLLKTLAQITE